MVLGFEDPDALPRLSPPTFWCMIALLVLVWLFLRVRLARRQIATHGEAATRLGFVAKLAGTPAMDWILIALAAGLGLAAVLLR